MTNSLPNDIRQDNDLSIKSISQDRRRKLHLLGEDIVYQAYLQQCSPVFQSRFRRSTNNGQKQLGFLESRASSGMFHFHSDLQQKTVGESYI